MTQYCIHDIAPVGWDSFPNYPCDSDSKRFFLEIAFINLMSSTDYAYILHSFTIKSECVFNSYLHINTLFDIIHSSTLLVLNNILKFKVVARILNKPYMSCSILIN